MPEMAACTSRFRLPSRKIIHAIVVLQEAPNKANIAPRKVYFASFACNNATLSL
jgi:hypothetical protein